MRKLILVLAVMAAVPAFGQEKPHGTTKPMAIGGVEDARFLTMYSKDKPAEFKPAFQDKAAWEARAAFVRNQALVAQNLMPMPAKTALQAQIYGKIEKERLGYSVEKVVFQSLPGQYVTGNLYRPLKVEAGRKLPAVLAPYGHWPNGRFMWTKDEDIEKNIKAGAEKTPEGARSPLQAGCANLAMMGCVVFQWDLVGYCDGAKLPIKHQEGFTDPEAVQRAQSFLGLQSWNSIRALDFVASLPDVDTGRIACMGASSGGTQTIQLSVAEKDRLAAVFPMVMISMNMQGGCVCENAPLLRVGTDNVELAALFAPKPQGAAAANDWTHDFETRGLPEMREVYGLYGKRHLNDISGKWFDFGHNFNVHSRELMYNFMNKTLGLGLTEPVTERAYEPIAVEELSVWDEEHRVPKDALDAAGVRAYWTKTSDEQLHALARANAGEYAKVLDAALQAMVVDAVPAASHVVATQATSNSSAVQYGWLSRTGAGERVPYARTTPLPQEWDGTVVIVVDPRGTKVVDHLKLPEVEAMKKGRAMVLAVTPYLSETFKPAKALKAPQARLDYSAYTNGYNRTTLANRVHDLLTAVAYAKSLSGVKAIRILAWNGGAPQAVLAAALARNDVDKLAADLAEWDFDQVKTNDDLNLLPAVQKYGGLMAYAGLVATRSKVLLTNPSATSDVPEASNISLPPTPQSNAQLAGWLLQP